MDRDQRLGDRRDRRREPSGNIVTGLQVNGELTLYAAGVNSPPPQGVGVYAIPSTKWTTAITNGWPIISETGGLGTRETPWVGFTGSTSVAESHRISSWARRSTTPTSA